MLQTPPEDFTPIPTMLVSYDCGIKFDVYVRKGRHYLLFAKHGELSGHHKHRLAEHGVDTLYVHSEDISSYEDYIEKNFSGVLQDDSIPIQERSRMLYDYSIILGKHLLQCREKTLPDNSIREKIETLASNTYDYLSKKDGVVKSVTELLSHNYRTYSHCVNVSIYTLILLIDQGYDRQKAKRIASGAFLHDIGKIKIPRHILDKKGRLTMDERLEVHKHPAAGLALTQSMDLDPLTVECIIHHHEKLDGTGYPAKARRIPHHVRIVTMTDIYDALTSSRPYSKPYNPFEALKIISKDVEVGRLCGDIFRDFVRVLTEGQIISD